MNKQDSNFIGNITKKVGKAINHFGMIQENDSVLVGISGGKDSLVLLETLVRRLDRLPVNYKVSACHINILDVPYQINSDFLKTFCTELNVQFYNIDKHAGINDSEKPACFICSWTRRKELFKQAQHLGYNKVAIGHHMDDMLETLFMNMTHHGEYSTMPPLLKMFDNKITLIRPLTYLTDIQLKQYATIKGFAGIDKNCPHEDETQRKEMKDVIERLSKMHRRAKINLFRSMININTEYLPKPLSSKT